MSSRLAQWVGRHVTGRWMPPVLFALMATALAMASKQTYPTSDLVRKLNNVWYDFLYRMRPLPEMLDKNIVVVAVDDKSLADLDRADVGWPWPRDQWANAVECIAACKPKAIVFDMLYTEKGPMEADFGGDAAFGEAVNRCGVPVVFATIFKEGLPGRFAPKVARPVFGAVNVVDIEDEACRFYLPYVEGMPSLAVQALQQAEPGRSFPGGRFRLHFYGPHIRKDGEFTFPYISISHVIEAGQAIRSSDDRRLALERFGKLLRGKYVLIGPTAPALFDVSPTPLYPQTPRVELHATAIENLIRGDQVLEYGGWWPFWTALASSLAASFAAAVPRGVWAKLIASSLTIAVLLVPSALLFRGPTIEWLAIAASVVATVSTTIFSLGWSYGIEDRQSRFFLKALSQSLSPAVAEELRTDPRKLNIGGQRRFMSVMFSDIAGFTDLSESMEVETLNELLNYYLNRMSAVVIENDGTLDKYIGDAIMAFWNAPLNQEDHAVRACRSALRMVQAENEMQPELRRRGATRLLTRIGINTGEMAVGNLGSDVKFAYTVIGDNVNLAARLEGANKLYGTQICLAQNTAELVAGEFLLRKLDVLRVKGKKKPMAVYELLAEGEGSERQRLIVRQYQRAFAWYQEQQWDEAEKVLLELLREVGEDGPSAALLTRISKFRTESPGAQWDGVYVAKDK